MKKQASPKPVVVTTICSMCGLGWELHGDDPTTEDCIRLLKAELAKRPITWPVLQPIPYPVPLPGATRPWGPTWWQSQPTSTCQTNGTLQQTLSFNTPRIIESTCTPIS